MNNRNESSLAYVLPTSFRAVEQPTVVDNVINEQWVYAHLLEAIYLNDDLSTDNIPPFQALECKLMPRLLPEASPLQSTDSRGNVVDQILNIMLAKSVRRGCKGLVMPFMAEIRERLSLLVQQQQPINFVLPSLPFKDQSPFGTGARIDHADLGEYCFFAQIKRVLHAIKHVYVPGAHMTILCDGYIYADIFVNDNKDGAGRYKAKCESIKNAYQLYNDVTLFDMREVFFNVPHWQQINDTIQNKIWHLYQTNAVVKERLDFLARRFVYYVALPQYNYSSAREMYATTPWPPEVWKTLLDAAVKYASIHLTMRKTNVVARAFPFAIRCTVHPKAAPQLPLHVTNSHNVLLPYNGVAVVSRQALLQGASLFQACRVRRLCEVMRYQDIYAIYYNTAKDPFYYEIP